MRSFLGTFQDDFHQAPRPYLLGFLVSSAPPELGLIASNLVLRVRSVRPIGPNCRCGPHHGIASALYTTAMSHVPGRDWDLFLSYAHNNKDWVGRKETDVPDDGDDRIPRDLPSPSARDKASGTGLRNGPLPYCGNSVPTLPPG